MSAGGSQLSYRERDVDQTLSEHDKRISNNERRWLVAKGALGMLAIIKGSEVGLGQLVSLI